MRIFEKYIYTKKQGEVVDTVTKWVVKGFQSFDPVSFVISFALSYVVSRIFSKKPPKPVDNGVRQQIPPSTTNSIPMVYGDAYLGGMFVDAALSQNGKTMYYVMVVSSLSPNGQVSFDTTKFYYGDRLMTFDATDQSKVISLTDQAGNVKTQISNDLNVYLYKSNAAGTITALNTALMPHEVMAYNSADKTTVPAALAWPSTNRQMNGLAFAIIKLHYNSDQQITSLDPITFHFSQYLNGQGCAKPGDVWKDFLENPYYGGAVDTDLIDTSSATALNTYSDQTIPYTPSGGGALQYQPRYRINGVLDTGQNVLSNINKILDSCDSWMQYNAVKGQWSIVINKAETSSFSFNDDNIIDDIRVSTVDLNQSPNQIEVRFPNKLNKDISDYVYIKTPNELLFPNEPVNKLTLDLDMVNNNIQAQYLGNRILEQAREDLMVTIKTTYEGIQVNAGDVVDITNSYYGWTNKLFRVMKVNEVAQADSMLNAILELSEYNAQVYDNKDITQFTASGNSDIANIAYFGALYAPTITDQQPNAAVPSFSVDVITPSQGQILYVFLYYTTVSSPSQTDWTLWGTLQATASDPYDGGITLKFPHIGLPTGTYYFAYKVGNNIGYSDLSSLSTAYIWLPNPSSTAVAGTFIAQFSPPTMQVPYNSGTPSFSYIAPQLYGTTSGGSVDFVASQTDSDALFVNNTWRIGGSSTTGYGDIVKTNITVGNPSDGGFYALWPQPSAMSNSPATIEVPVRYKDNDGNVTQGATAIQQLIFQVNGTDGVDGTQTGTATLYQWSTATPSDPNGYSTFVWATATNTNYTGTGSWTTTIPANPSTPSIKLWQASIGVSAIASAITTSVDWSTGFSVADITENGATGDSGVQTANAVVYQWATSIPSGPTGTGTYTWASGSISAAPSGWSLTSGTAPSAGYTLYAATVRLVDSATASTSSIVWSTASISAISYAGSNGSSYRQAFARVAGNPTPVAGTITTSGSASFPTSGQSSSTWGFSATWSADDPNPSSSNSLYQTDGIYNPSTNQTVWSTPYISALKVGSLSAITVNTGGLTVTDYIKAGSSPAVSGTTMTGTGFTLNSGGTFAIGNSSKNLSFNGSTLTMNGDLVVTGNIVNNAITSPFTGEDYTPRTLPGVDGENIIAWAPTITVPTSGILLITTSVAIANRSTGTDYKVQLFVTIDSSSNMPVLPIYKINSGAAYDARMPIAVLFPDNNYYTSGSCALQTLTEAVSVIANQTVTLGVVVYTSATSTNLCYAGASYTAILMKK